MALPLPDAPNIRKRPIVSSSTLEFYWSPPSNAESSLPTSYTLSDGGPNVFSSIQSNAGYYKVSSLSDGISYTFSLAASNATGLGVSTLFRTIQPGLKPSAPDNPTYSSIGNNTYQIFWQTSTNTSKAGVLGYAVQAWPTDSTGAIYPKGSVPRIKLSTSGSNISSAILQVSTNYNYKFIIQSVNDPGYSPQTCVTSIVNQLPGSGTSFSTLNNLKAWYDASGASNFVFGANSTVLTWYDKSGSFRHASSGTVPPIFRTSSNGPGVLFSTSQTQSLILPRGTLSPLNYQYDSYIVLKTSGIGEKGLLTSGSNTANNLNQLSLSTTSVVQNWNGNEYRSPSSFGTPAKQLIRASYTGTQRITQVYTNNLGNSTIISSFTNSITTTGRDSFPENNAIGVTFGNSNYFDGSIHEVLLFDRYLPSSENNLITSYLWNKWMKSPLQNFVPTDFAGLYQWYNPQQFTGIANGTTIFTWSNSVIGRSNMTGIARVSTFSTGLTSNSTILDFLSTQQMDTNVLANEQLSSYTVCTLVRGFGGNRANNRSVFIGSGYNSNASIGYGSNGSTDVKTFWNDGSLANLRQPTTLRDSNWDIYTVNRSTLSNTINRGVGWINYFGSSLLLTFNSLYFYSTTNYLDTLKINPGLVTGSKMNGQIADLIAYSTCLSVEEYQKVEGYLWWKFNFISSSTYSNLLPNTHPYRTIKPTTFNSNW